MDSSSQRRALVMMMQHHGDVLLSSPVVSTLALAGYQVDALVFEDTKPMIAGHPDLDQLHGIVRRGRRQLGLWGWLKAEWQLLSTLRSRNYDLVVHLTKRRRGAWLCRLLRPKVSVASDMLRDRFWRKSFTHLYHDLPWTRHMVEVHLDALRRIGIRPNEATHRMHLTVDDASRSSAHALLAQHGLQPGEYIQVHPTSRWMYKAWPAEKMAAVINTLTAAGEKVLLTAAKEPQEMAMIEAIKARLERPVVDLSGQITLKQLGALIADAKLWLGLDSAPMHMASALGTPCVALFGPSVDGKWAPWKVPNRMVANSDYRCRPCNREGCGDGQVSDCLVNLPEQVVLGALRSLADEVGKPLALA
ncbi:putative lipopolysaccharide heptosyltransferase III [Chitinimonas sp. PSY-7]|uniref:putative lipopolysaccharide heptosyltransferase III n=1 Tax=Chitinimonas sp. PSY-7 TaxID=3459088 RepID=UPI00403FC8B6